MSHSPDIPRLHDLVVTRNGARFMGQFVPCSIGKGGIVEAKQKAEGDGATPAGSYAILGLWWRADRLAPPATVIPCHHMPTALGWSDDPADALYNCPAPLGRKQQERTLSAESMRRADPLYDLVLDMDWNRTPPIAGKGSAIFLHVWRKPRHPTEGCIAFDRRDLEWIIANWCDDSRVIIRG